jgi:uncharacterized protein
MPFMNQLVTVIKRNLVGQEVIRYTGLVLQRRADAIILKANFNRPDMLLMNTVLKLGDRFIETYYTDRWYNIFEIHDRQDDHLKGWYCNIGMPAQVDDENQVSYVDLVLDLWVSPDREQTVLDEDEFAALNLDSDTRLKALAALAELQDLFSNNQEPGLD